MQSITFTCEVITPMFLAGADGQTPELRAPSIKGAMRFWWRAMNGHLGLSELKKIEGEIFGNTENRSSFGIQIKQSVLKTSPHALVPHKSFMTQQAFDVTQRFDIKFTLCKVTKWLNFNQLKSLFELIVCLGGFGKRSRRGFGGVKIVSSISNTGNLEEYQAPISINEISALLSNISSNYTVSGNSIRNSYQGRMEQFGWIKQIQVGSTKSTSISKTTSQVTHDLKQKYRNAYEPNLGHAFKGRFASPILVSVIGNEKLPIITSLNIVPDKGSRDLDSKIQEDFKGRIL